MGREGIPLQVRFDKLRDYHLRYGNNVAINPVSGTRSILSSNDLFRDDEVLTAPASSESSSVLNGRLIKWPRRVMQLRYWNMCLMISSPTASRQTDRFHGRSMDLNWSHVFGR